MNKKGAFISGGLVGTALLVGLLGSGQYAGIPCVQGQNCALGSGSTINGGTPVGRLTAPLALIVNGTLGNDSSSCLTTGAGACKTFQGALNKIPGREIPFPVTITDEIGGSYAGFHLENYQMEPLSGGNAGGAYIELRGVNKLAFFSGLPSTGATSSATQLSGNNFATMTVVTGGWAANQTRGFQLNITAGTGVGQTRTIYGNTATVITIAGSWATTPDNTSQWQILDPCNGGAVLANDPTQVPAQAPTPGFASANTTGGTYTDILVSNVQPAAAKPWLVRAQSPSSKGGSVYLTNFCFSGTSNEVATIRNSSGVVIRYSRMTNQTPASGCYITTDSPNTVVANDYATGAAASSYSLVCYMNSGVNMGEILDGNVLDAMALVEGTFGPGGPATGTGFVNLETNANSVQNLQNEPAITVNECNDCNLSADKIETTTGGTGANGYCVSLGCSIDQANCRGSFSTGKIAGGFYNACATGGLLLAGGYWNLRTTALTGTATAGAGIDVRAGAVVDNAALATITGPSGDITLNQGSTFFSWANLGTWGAATNIMTGARIYSGVPNVTVGKVFTGFTDTSGTPGNATANTNCGRSAVAAAASTIVITNSSATTTSQVDLTLESKDSTCTNLYVTTLATGSFTITCSAAATAATKFNWCVNN